MPLILGTMQQNAATPQGAQALNNILENLKHAIAGMVDMLDDLMGSGDSSALLKDGTGIY